MTISYPRDLPTPFPWRPAKFELAYVQSRSSTRGGVTQVANIGRDYWTMRYETHALREPQAEAFEAWLSSLRGGARLFKAFRPQREYPIAYPNGFAGLTVGGEPFSGSAKLDDVAETLDEITLADLPANFAVKAGDMFSFGYNTSRRALHRVLEDATASGGGVVDLTVEPTIALGYDLDADVLLANPYCHAVLDAASVQITWQLGRKASFAFSANQSH